MLKKLDSKFCTAVGVSADWGLLCEWFLRRFDVAYHDIACSRVEVECMIETLEAVFLRGNVFRDIVAGAATMSTSASGGEPLPPIQASASGELVQPGFITSAVVENLQKRYIFYAGGYPVLLWGAPDNATIDELAKRVANAAALTCERLRADFPDDDARAFLSAFDRRRIERGFSASGDSRVRREVLHGVKKLAAALGVEEAAAVLQYNSVLPWILQRSSDPAQKPVSNQSLWAMLLDPNVWGEAVPKRLRASDGALATIIRFYISIEGGECTVERDFARSREVRLS